MVELDVVDSPKLFVAYRVYPKFSKNAYTEGFENKFDMFRKCLTSFIGAINNLDYRIHFLMDSCPDAYISFIEKNVPDGRYQVERLTNAGNRKTFVRQIEVLSNQNFSDLVYFAEDDYLYRAQTLNHIIDFLKGNKADFVTPYDHPDYYPETSCIDIFQHEYRSEVKYSKGLHFRTVASTTLTFLTTVRVLKETSKFFSIYLTRKVGDHQIWLMLTRLKRKTPWALNTINMYRVAPIQMLMGKTYTLYSPVPGLSIHLAKPCVEKMGDLESFQLQ